MEDLWTGIGRGVDGMVGRVVDWLGSGTSSARPGPRPASLAGKAGSSVEPWDDTRGDSIALVRFTIVRVSDSRARVIHTGEALEAGPLRREDLEARVLERFEKQNSGRALKRGEARVFVKVLKRWPREAPPETSERARTTRRRAARPQAERKPRRAGRAPDEEGSLAHRLLELLLSAENGLSMREIVRQTGERSGTLRLSLQRLIAAQEVQRVGEGLKTLYRGMRDQES